MQKWMIVIMVSLFISGFFLLFSIHAFALTNVEGRPDLTFLILGSMFLVMIGIIFTFAIAKATSTY